MASASWGREKLSSYNDSSYYFSLETSVRKVIKASLLWFFLFYFSLSIVYILCDCARLFELPFTLVPLSYEHRFHILYL